MMTTYHFISAYMQARFADDERGASLVEYALLVALIAIVVIGAITFIGESADTQFSSVGTAVSEAGN